MGIIFFCLLNIFTLFFKDHDLIIVPDGGNEEGTMIEVAEKSMLWVKFTVIGRQCHASTPQKGKNSLFGAAKLILALSQLKERFDLADNLFRPPESTFESTKMEANVPIIVRPYDCAYCGLCEETCPEGAIALTYEIVLASDSDE